MQGNAITYTHPNGYSAKLYGKSSMIILDPQGKESLHTGFRNVNTKEEVMELLEEHPVFLQTLSNINFDDVDEEYDI